MVRSTETIRILHVDDKPEFTELTATYLEREDDRIDVRTADSVDKGLKLLTECVVDCIVSDYDMPHTNGIAFLEAVREEYPDLPFILFTGKGSEEVASEAISAGVTDYLQKGTGTEQYMLLANRVWNAVEQSRANQRTTEEHRINTVVREVKEALARATTHREIDEQQRQELEQTNTLLSTLFETVPQGMLAENESREILAVNHRLFDLFDLSESPDALVGTDGSQLVTDISEKVAGSEQFVERTETIVSAHEAVDSEELELMDGRTLERSYRPLSLPGGDGHLWVYVDSTEQIEYQETLRALQYRTRALISARNETEIATEAVSIAEEVLNFPLSGVHLVDDEQTRLVPVAVTDSAREHLGGAPVYDRENPSRSIDTLHWDVFEQGTPVVIENAHAHDAVSVDDTPSRSGIIYPLGDHGLFITSSPEANAFDENDVNLVELLATIITAGLDRIERESRLQRTSTQLEVLFDRSPDMINMHDTEGNILDPNKQLCQATGYSHAELTEMKVWDLDRMVDRDEITTVWEAMDVGDRRKLESVYQRRDGTTFPVQVHIRRLALDGEDRFMVISRDVSERKKTEQDRERIQELMELALDRTDSIIFEIDTETGVETRYGPFERIYGITSDAVPTTEEFYQRAVHPESREKLKRIQTERMIEGETETAAYEHRTHPDNGEIRWVHSRIYSQSSGEQGKRLVGMTTDITERKKHEQKLARQNELLSEFAGTVSHDLRNPLNVASARLELLATDCDSEHIKPIHDAHARMEALIDDLLVLSREGEEVSEPELFDFATLVTDCWSTVETGDATIITDIDRSIRADKSRLRQLIENLFHNAVTHGGANVTVTVGELETGFYVEDDGPGIPEDARSDVFESGYSTEAQGTGFGLSIAQQIAEAHGWDISVTDGAEGGARFEITGVAFADG